MQVMFTTTTTVTTREQGARFQGVHEDRICLALRHIDPPKKEYLVRHRRAPPTRLKRSVGVSIVRSRQLEANERSPSVHSCAPLSDPMPRWRFHVAQGLQEFMAQSRRIGDRGRLNP